LAKAKARRRQKEEKEEKGPENQSIGDRQLPRQLRPAELREKKRLKQETLVRQRCVEEGCPQEELVLEEVVERVQEDKAASPELRAAVVDVSQLLADWGAVQKESEEGGIPIKKA
jgi:hypothetical protein